MRLIFQSVAISAVVILAILAFVWPGYVFGRPLWGQSVVAGQPSGQPTAVVTGQTGQTGASTTTGQQPSDGSPYNLPPQPQIGHPSLYLETGVPDPVSGSSANTKRWVIDVLPNTVAIVGGFIVDGVSNGVYKAIAGPAKLDTTVTDGFLAITKAEWANAEWCFRIAQAVQYGWAHNIERPLPVWTACK